MAQDRILRPSLKVAKRPLPFKHIERVNRQMMKQINKHLATAAKAMAEEVIESSPDPTDVLLAQASEQNLQRSWERRCAYRPPYTYKVKGTKVAIRKVLKKLALEEIDIQKPMLKGTEATDLKREVVPLGSVMLLGKVSMEKVVKLLSGEEGGETPVVAEADNKMLKAVSGIDTVVAAKIAGEEVIQVLKVESLKFMLTEEGKMKAMSALMRLREVEPSLASNRSSLSLAYEPLADLARRLDMQDFVDIVNGKATAEELNVNFVADRKEREKSAIWDRLYGEAREQGMSVSEASRWVEKHVDYNKVVSLMSAFHQRRAAIEEKNMQLRIEASERLKDVLVWLVEEDTDLLPLVDIWTEANKTA